MKTKDIAKKHNLNNADFDRWLKESGYTYKSGMMGGLDVDESQNLDEILVSFRQHLVHEKERVARETSDRERAEAQKQAALAAMLITTGFSFEGHRITKYAGYISGDDAVQVDRGTDGIFARATNVGDSLMASMGKIRENALHELREAAYALGCNAVIGVDFDYLTLDPETARSGGGTVYLPYVFGVTANGTAVIIEPQTQTT